MYGLQNVKQVSNQNAYKYTLLFRCQALSTSNVFEDPVFHLQSVVFDCETPKTEAQAPQKYWYLSTRRQGMTFQQIRAFSKTVCEIQISQYEERDFSVAVNRIILRQLITCALTKLRIMNAGQGIHHSQFLAFFLFSKSFICKCIYILACVCVCVY